MDVFFIVGGGTADREDRNPLEEAQVLSVSPQLAQSDRSVRTSGHVYARNYALHASVQP